MREGSVFVLEGSQWLVEVLRACKEVSFLLMRTEFGVRRHFVEGLDTERGRVWSTRFIDKQVIRTWISTSVIYVRYTTGGVVHRLTSVQF